MSFVVEEIKTAELIAVDRATDRLQAVDESARKR